MNLSLSLDKRNHGEYITVECDERGELWRYRRITAAGPHRVSCQSYSSEFDASLAAAKVAHCRGIQAVLSRAICARLRERWAQEGREFARQNKRWMCWNHFQQEACDDELEWMSAKEADAIGDEL